MKIFDFGKNTHQFAINFKFDCISLEIVRGLVHKLLVEKKLLSTVSKDQTSNQTLLTKGEGTEKAPLSQLKIGPDAVYVWAGWYVGYEKWQQWRTSILAETIPVLQSIPVELVSSLVSQSGIMIPAERVKQADQIPELEPLRAFYRRFLPEQLIRRGNAYVLFGDEELRQTVEWWVGGSTIPGEENVAFNVRTNILDTKLTLDKNLKSHFASSDKLLENFHSGFLCLVIKG